MCCPNNEGGQPCIDGHEWTLSIDVNQYQVPAIITSRYKERHTRIQYCPKGKEKEKETMVSEVNVKTHQGVCRRALPNQFPGLQNHIFSRRFQTPLHQ